MILRPRPLTPEESAMVADALLGARLVRPYYARAIAALSPVAAPGLGTVAVDDSWRLYVDPEWFEGLPLPERAAVIAAHEVEHLLRGHGARRAACGADPKPWNIAADAEINDDSADVTLPDGCVTPARLGAPEGLLAEEYLSYLPASPPSTCGGGSGAGRPLDGEMPAVGGVSPEEADGIRDAVAADVRSADAATPGSVPAGVVVWAEARARRHVEDWRAILARSVRHACGEVARGREDYSWSRLNRRARAGAPLRPGSVRHVPRVVVVADTSGSMVDAGGDVRGVVEAIVRICPRAVVLCADAEIASRARGVPREYRGGGGTDLRGAIGAAERCGDVVVVVTDAVTPWPESAPRIPVVVARIGTAECPPWARVVQVRP